ncbi:early growth response protein 1-like [Pollicipes pollicipes]|nr:early growth response protein 1-like [Pollicipes pollicipes]
MTFSNKGQLTGHFRKHTGERPFECETCHKRFTRNEELTRHTRIHTGDRPFGCEICGKRFGRKDHLNKHQRTHTTPLYAAYASMTSAPHGVLSPFPFGYGAETCKLLQ